jgi:hypothetical protein
VSLIDLLVEPLDDVGLSAIPHPRYSRTEIAPHPDSPVGRTVVRLAVDPEANSPLRTLETRLEHQLLDLTRVTDLELHALTDLLLAEKHRRAARWLSS